jgi:hypothetical protein
MPRKVTDSVVASFLQGKPKRVGNSSTDGIYYTLNGNDIARIEDGDLWVSDAGWASITTYERLNRLPGVNVSVKQGKTYLNGVPWDGNWINLGKINTLESRIMKKPFLKIEARKLIRRIIKEEVKRALTKNTFLR